MAYETHYSNYNQLTQKILHMNYSENLSVAEIARRLDIPVQTIRYWYQHNWKIKANPAAIHEPHRIRFRKKLDAISAEHGSPVGELLTQWHRQGISQREMSRRTGLNRRTVRKLLVACKLIPSQPQRRNTHA